MPPVKTPAPYSIGHDRAHKIAALVRHLSYICAYQMRHDPGATNETILSDYNHTRDQIVIELRLWLKSAGLTTLP